MRRCVLEPALDPANADRGTREPEHWRPARLTTCPACKQQQSGCPGGYVQVEGAFLITHRDEIERLLRNEAERAAEDSPLGRIMDWKEDAAKLTLATTTEHLAQRLGHALEKAYGGKVHYDFSHENKLARVKWCRNRSRITFSQSLGVLLPGCVRPSTRLLVRHRQSRRAPVSGSVYYFMLIGLAIMPLLIARR